MPPPWLIDLDSQWKLGWRCAAGLFYLILFSIDRENCRLDHAQPLITKADLEYSAGS